MRGSVIASSIVHGAVVVVLFVSRPPVSVVVPGPDVVQVALVEPTANVAVVTPPPPSPPKPSPERIEKTADEGVKLPEPRKPKPPQREPEREQPAPATTAPALPYAPVGNAGLQGQLTTDSDFEFTYYLTLVRNRVAQGWTPPAGLSAGGKPVRAVVYFKIGRGGDVLAARLESSSGYDFFDRSAVRAVQLGDPMPPLPLGYSGADLGVHFGFEYVAP